MGALLVAVGALVLSGCGESDGTKWGKLDGKFNTSAAECDTTFRSELAKGFVSPGDYAAYEKACRKAYADTHGG